MVTSDDQAPEFLADDAEQTNENFVKLRNHAKDLDKALREERRFRETAEPRLRAAALKEAGFDPESPQAEALQKLHEGEFEPDAIKQTAERYGFAAGGSEASEGTSAAKPELSAEQQQAIESSRRGDQLSAQAAPVEPQADTEALREAYEKGDLQAAYAIQERRLQALKS